MFENLLEQEIPILTFKLTDMSPWSLKGDKIQVPTRSSSGNMLLYRSWMTTTNLSGAESHVKEKSRGEVFPLREQANVFLAVAVAISGDERGSHKASRKIIQIGLNAFL